ncbi:tRNA (adenosine(37)-N6)-threonylcarbamoyltransferase complex ATPase subunit type 1 TsaE [bacterium]|nr:MAG: tRNA (adenosine(37)-N6)-threonylcarbamoyltransferase complex ATPase subunit type 1 TsaE [bacterium]
MTRIKLSQAVKKADILAKKLRGGEVLALSGNLGSGKTTFTKALAKGLGVAKTVTSPTFVIMQQYKTKLKTASKQPVWLYHLDLYRANSFAEVEDLGLKELWGRPEVITVIEWSEKIEKYLPKQAIRLNFTRDIKQA